MNPTFINLYVVNATAIMVPRLTRREVADAWYTLTTVFGDFNLDRVMFEKIEIEV